jgi:hypothetical protein
VDMRARGQWGSALGCVVGLAIPRTHRTMWPRSYVGC